MNRSNFQSRTRAAMDSAKALARKVATGASLALASGAAMAQDSSYPTTIDGIQAWAEPKLAIGVGLTVLMTCVILAIKISKTPRRA